MNHCTGLILSLLRVMDATNEPGQDINGVQWVIIW